MKQVLLRVGLAFALVTGIAAPAMAQIEVGAQLINFSVVKPEEGSAGVAVGIPSSPFNFFTPGAYVAWAIGPKFAVEGNFGVAFLSQDDESAHFLNVGGQLDWFFKDHLVGSSPYVFGGAGVLHVTDSDAVATVSAGAGYRWKCGDRLTLRMAGRYTYITDNGGNMFDLGITIGGLFGGK